VTGSTKLSVRAHETYEELRLAQVPALPVDDELPEHGARRRSRGQAERLAVLGRLGWIWLPAYAFTIHPDSSRLAAALTATAIAALWYAALRAATPATRLIMPALGAVGVAAAGAVAGFASVSAAATWLPWLEIRPFTLLAMAAAIFVFSACWESVVARSVAMRRRTLIVGANDGGAEIVGELAVTRDTRFEVIGFVDDERETETIAGVPRFGGLQDLPRVLDEHRPDLVVLAVARNRPEVFASLLQGAGNGFELLGLPEFHEQAFGRVPLAHLTPAWFMSILHFYRRPYTQVAKRTFDIVVAAAGLALTAPLFPLLFLLVKRTPGPAVFRQTRLGEGGTHFTMYKFRTMREDAEHPGLPLWAAERDPRTTPGGRFLRKTRLDELPQLWNVLKGDMSIVGPRPERPEFLEYLQQAVPYWTRRHLVKPGITGWAQVRRGYTADADGTSEKLSYDLWYLRHRSLMIDLAICAKTAGTIFSGSGSR
jgi:exopolysaccharide biosynthesis polyprenyl glycosylphosphotransferase